MNLNSLRVDRWGDIFLSLMTMLLAVVIWYTRDFYLYWVVFVAGIGAGVVLYFITKLEEDHPVATFPITMIFILVMLIALYEETLVSGVVAAFTTTTAIKVYDVYL